jgi:putative spermidine/putrescine transport system permease protein
MLSFDSEAFSLRWYEDILRNGMAAPDEPLSWAWFADTWNNGQWMRAIRNSFFIGICATLLATALGTLAAIGLSRSEMPYRRLIMSILISPMIVPLVITAAGMFFFYSRIHLSQTYLGVIMAHAILGTPFVIITVTATLVGFDKSLVRAANSLGAGPITTFRRVQMPLILPGVVSGGLFAFITSFDEVVAVLFLASPEQRTIPRQMWSGIREQISPTILAVATLLVILSIILLTVLELLRRRSERLRGIMPS